MSEKIPNAKDPNAKEYPGSMRREDCRALRFTTCDFFGVWILAFGISTRAAKGIA